MTINEYAIDEFKAAGFINEDGEYCDEMQKQICKDILDILDIFNKQGHSGFSANYAINILEKLLRFEPITPLNGTNDEWVVVRDGLRQNKRCSRVFFDDKKGYAYDINGKVFVENNGVSYTSRDSRIKIEFPYTPKTEFINV